jgi:hypothetical protein
LEEEKETEIIYTGEEVSVGLSQTVTNFEQLQRWNLPQLDTPLALADALNLKLGQLRFLTYHRKVSWVNHYKRFYIPKKWVENA